MATIFSSGILVFLTDFLANRPTGLHLVPPHFIVGTLYANSIELHTFSFKF